MNTKFRYFGLLLLLTALVIHPARTCLAGPEDTAAQVTAALLAGNAAEVSKHFSAMVDLTLPGFDDTYSKAQAGQILKDFFSQNPVKGFKVTRQGSSPDGSFFTIGSLETGKKAYRVYFIVKSSGGQHLLQQLQVQDN